VKGIDPIPLPGEMALELRFLLEQFVTNCGVFQCPMAIRAGKRPDFAARKSNSFMAIGLRTVVHLIHPLRVTGTERE
jgi:hypothetical protein